MQEKNNVKVIKKDGSYEVVKSFPGISFQFLGDNNNIIIHEGTRFAECTIQLTSNNNISIDSSKYGITRLRIFGNNSVIKIGRNFSCWGTEIRCHEHSSSVSIGNECMFSEEILLYPTDVHTIFDQFTGQVLNMGRPIKVGNHVWCGRAVTILKGGTIRDDTVIASKSLVTSAFNESNIIIGGSPAAVLKRGVNWSRESPYEYQKQLEAKR